MRFALRFGQSKGAANIPYPRRVTMTRYIIKRLLALIPIMLCVMLVVYALLYTSFGANKRAISSYNGGDWLDKVFERLGIEETFVSRYLRYCTNVIFKLDFGKQNGTIELRETMTVRLKMTLKLTMWGFLGTLVFGIGIGVLAAVKHGKWLDDIVMFFITFLSSIPSFTFALILVLIFTLELRLLPSFGFRKPGSMIMPSIALAVSGIASTARLTRSGMIEILNDPFVLALRSKGLRGSRIIFVHVLKNTMVPVVASLTQVMSQMLCGSMIIERFFSLPGLGTLVLAGVSNRNQPTLMGASCLIAFMLSVANILGDILYAAVDPQIREQYIAKGRKRGKRA